MILQQDDLVLDDYLDFGSVSTHLNVPPRALGSSFAKFELPRAGDTKISPDISRSVLLEQRRKAQSENRSKSLGSAGIPVK
jgi:hypothetical protein